MRRTTRRQRQTAADQDKNDQDGLRPGRETRVTTHFASSYIESSPRSPVLLLTSFTHTMLQSVSQSSSAMMLLMTGSNVSNFD